MIWNTWNISSLERQDLKINFIRITGCERISSPNRGWNSRYTFPLSAHQSHDDGNFERSRNCWKSRGRVGDDGSEGEFLFVDRSRFSILVNFWRRNRRHNSLDQTSAVHCRPILLWKHSFETRATKVCATESTDKTTTMWRLSNIGWQTACRGEKRTSSFCRSNNGNRVYFYRETWNVGILLIIEWAIMINAWQRIFGFYLLHIESKILIAEIWKELGNQQQYLGLESAILRFVVGRIIDYTTLFSLLFLFLRFLLLLVPIFDISKYCSISHITFGILIKVWLFYGTVL